jgi:hypothetical protein
MYSHHESHLLVAEAEGEILGYLILGLQPYLNARIASVLEFCAWKRNPDVSDALLSQAQRLAKQMGASAMTTWESHEPDINESLLRHGYFNIGRSVFSVGVTSLDFIKQALESNNLVQQSSANEARASKDLLIDLGAKPFPGYTGTFVLRVYRDGKVSVLENNPGVAPYAHLQTDTVTFCEVILGLHSSTAALFFGGIQVKPASKIVGVAKILRRLSKRVDWYLPLGDHF